MNKQRSYISRILLLILVGIGIALWSLFTVIDRKNLTTTLDKTTTFVKNRITRFDTYSANDRVKSLVRLLDKTTELNSNILNDSSFDEESLETYIEEQRLTGVVILDENLNVVLESNINHTSSTVWKSLMDNSAITDILNYPQKTYTLRLEDNGITYDFAIVNKSKGNGLIIAYVEKEVFSEENGDLILDSLFTDFPFEMNGIVAVCDDTKVISSNSSELQGKTIEECKALTKSKHAIKEGELTKNKVGNTIWFGTKAMKEDYTIYVFFPASQVFMSRSVVCSAYLGLALLVYLMYRQSKERLEKDTLIEEQKRLQTINALGGAYSTITLVDLKQKEIEVIKSSTWRGELNKRTTYSKAELLQYITSTVNQNDAKAYLDFVNLDTISSRLKGKDVLSFTYLTTTNTWLTSTIVPQECDNEGNATSIIFATSDVTEQKEKELQQEEALRNALAVAEHANKAKTVFLNNMSHDIRTPMNAIIGFTALAVTHVDNKERVLDYLKKISTSSKHLLSLINDILDMSRIESGSVKIEESNVHLPDILHDLRTIIQGQIYAKNLDLYIDTQDIVHEDIVTDKLRLNQVLLNIISNAVKFTPIGGMINIRVTEKASTKEGYATYSFSIKDNGIGISKEFQKHIFDSFARERTITESGIEGTGLGLAIAKNIVDLMNGTITVNSEQGKGSEFIVTIECKISDHVTKYEPIPELHGAKALVVDDDANTCISVCKMLRGIEMVAEWTTSGKEAVLKAQDAYEQKEEFKVYIIDWIMPDMNGIETTRRIRRAIGNEAPIIILTAYDFSDIEEEAKEAGVTAFVSKPLFMSELREALSVPVEETKVVDTSLTRHKGKKVLLVEDNALNREIATEILQEVGIVVDSVNDGTDAVSRMSSASANDYDVILMDIQMPKMDGYIATREIRTLSNNKKANIPIIAMTANAFEEDKEKAFEAGMNGHIAKPISIDAVLEALDTIFIGNNKC